MDRSIKIQLLNESQGNETSTACFLAPQYIIGGCFLASGIGDHDNSEQLPVSSTSSEYRPVFGRMHEALLTGISSRITEYEVLAPRGRLLTTLAHSTNPCACLTAP
jgi:hypothetical protein